MTTRLVLLIGLTWVGPALLPTPVAGQAPPAYLQERLHKPFASFAEQPAHRAFALSRDGAWGTAYGHDSLDAARAAALSNCRAYADTCVVIAENETVVHPTPPFAHPPQETGLLERLLHPSRQTTFFLALAALAVLVLGTVIAERFPLYLFDTGVSDVLHLRLNYTVVPFGAVYFTLMLPLFARLAERDFSHPVTWILFAGPILLYVLSVLYLYRKDKLGDRFELK